VAKKKDSTNFLRGVWKSKSSAPVGGGGEGGEFYLTTLSTGNSRGYTADGRLMEYGTLVG